MLKKSVLVIFLLLTLFYPFLDVVNAYEYINPNNQNAVSDLINQIYDAKEQYEDLAGGYVEDDLVIRGATSSSYWWPIGSSDTVEANGKLYAKGDPETLNISSSFGYRKDPFNRGVLFHSGLDISGGSGLNNVNIIAARDGIVVYPYDTISNNCPSGRTLSSCGGGYGNYVILQHSDGNYTLYGHMYENSITVKYGDSVEQGQVIGKMGSSGNSTGAHLHFEVREGSNSPSATVDPTNYVSTQNPRVVYSRYTGNLSALGTKDGDLLSWLNSWEGHTKIIDDYYLVVDGGDGVRTAGAGITLENNVQSFLSYGIDVNDYPPGSTIPIWIVDSIELEVLASKRSSIENTLSKNSIVLEDYQIQALISQSYNIGNIKGFVENYQMYGNTQEFYDNWFFRAVSKGTKFERGLTRRRNAEWALFHTGEYVYNS